MALELLHYVKQHYASQLEQRYKLDAAGAMQDEDLLAAIGRNRGAVQRAAKVNLQKAAEIVLMDFRSEALGRISLETPEEFALWLAQGQALEAARLESKKSRGRAPGGA